MPEGTVKFFNRAKGFGFIVPDDGEKEVFLPPAAVTGVAVLSPGQRVSFEIVADPKGPKAASLKVLEGVVAPKPQAAPRPQTHVHAAPPPVAISLYCDPSTQGAQDVLAALDAQKQHAHVIDITATPPTAQQLRKWSQVLAERGQGLVRRSMPLFFDLQLDDRFLHEDEFWTAVVQHPALINGPILTVREQVRICKTAADVKAFFAGTAADSQTVSQSKNISSRLMAMMRGEAVGPRPPREPEPEYEQEDEPELALEPANELDEAVPEPAPAKKKAVAAKPAKPLKEKPAPKTAKPAAKKVVAKPAAKKAVKAAPAKKKAK